MNVKLRGLHELAAVKRVLEHRRQEVERQREAARRAHNEANLFAQAVGPVQPLKAHGRKEHELPRAAPWPRQRELDEQAALREALSDEVDVESLLETDAELSFRRPDIGPDVLKRLRRGQWAIQAEVDLHGLRRDEARERLGAFLREAMQLGLRCVRVVHGKGLGSPGRTPVLKGKVRAWLVQKSEVAAFVQARGSLGGHGALIVLLRGRAGPVPAAAPSPRA
jgi:DNA-nicking Smr family endonuclease